MDDAAYITDGFRWTATALERPMTCPRGHALTGGRVLIGSRGGHGSRWILCRECGLEGNEQVDGTLRGMQMLIWRPGSTRTAEDAAQSALCRYHGMDHEAR